MQMSVRQTIVTMVMKRNNFLFRSKHGVQNEALFARTHKHPVLNRQNGSALCLHMICEQLNAHVRLEMT